MKSLAAVGLAAAATLLSGCYRGGSKPVDMSQLAHGSNWLTIRGVPQLEQDGEHECGATALAMLLGYWNMPTRPEEIRAASGQPSQQGISAGFLRTYLRGRGMEAHLLPGTMADLERELQGGRPVLVGIQKKLSTGNYAHYQLVVGINRDEGELAVIDPADGLREYSFHDFAREWAPANALMLVAAPAASP